MLALVLQRIPCPSTVSKLRICTHHTCARTHAERARVCLCATLLLKHTQRGQHTLALACAVQAVSSSTGVHGGTINVPAVTAAGPWAGYCALVCLGT